MPSLRFFPLHIGCSKYQVSVFTFKQRSPLCVLWESNERVHGKVLWMVWSALLCRLCVCIIVEWACNAHEASNPLKSIAVPRISHYIWLLSSPFFSLSSFLLDQINFWQMFGKSSYPVIHIYKSCCCTVVPILPLHWSQKIIWENATFPVTNLEDLVSLAQFLSFSEF